MAEGKEYVTRPDELGNVHISESVLASIAAAAADEVEGVAAMAANLGTELVELLGGKKALRKGVHIYVEENSIRVELAVLIHYGFIIQDVARKVQEMVYSAVENTTGLTVECVNVRVAGIVFPKENKSAE
ncbi:MAG: Asp23/Gls24 family envelope stress response protein [Oscillospiraceae bacterium]|nr:Asp23/Gls24 family envelope stress response protein [Oscillospiraceae bacterium]